MDRSSKYYIVANLWAIATVAVSLSGHPYTATACAVAAVANVVADYTVKRSEKP